MTPNTLQLIAIAIILALVFKFSFDLFMLSLTPSSFIILMGADSVIMSDSIFLFSGFITCVWIVKSNFYERWFRYYKKWLS